MLMQMMSAGAMAAASPPPSRAPWVAAPRGRRRARGARLVIALGFGGAFMIAVLGGGRCSTRRWAAAALRSTRR